MKIKITNFCKRLYGASKLLLMLCGIMIVSINTAWSIYLLKGGTIDEVPKLDLSPFLKSKELLYIWIGIFIVFIVGFIVETIIGIIKGIKKAKDPNIDNGEKAKSFLSWLIKN